MIQWFKKLSLLRRNRAPISSRLDAILRPLHYAKCRADRRYAGLLIDQFQPVFLTVSELEPADVIFCAFDEKDLIHKIISHGSSGDYVHVALYTGDGKVVEAIQKGVVKDTLDNVIARYPYVAVCRCPGTKPNGLSDLSNKVVEFCEQHAEVKSPYNVLGAVKSPILELRELRYQQNWTKRLSSLPTNSGSKNSFFCSEFVIEAFIYGGYIQEGEMDSSKYSPSALAEDTVFDLVGYLGPADMAKHIRNHDYFLTGGISRG
ncbi:TPA: hypothetical protein PXN21_002148 [Yersinia enterocolitica]|nr:hypothetical protein [Yersinia enterocolitica]